MAADPIGVPLGAQGLLRGKTKRNGNCTELSARSSTGERLRISLKRAAFLNLPGLLRGGWAELHAPSKFVGANRKGPRPSTAQADFAQLTIVELQPSPINDEVRGAAWFLEPKKGPNSGREHAPANEVRRVIDSLASEIAAAITDASREDRHASREDRTDRRNNTPEDGHADSESDHNPRRSTTAGPPPGGLQRPTAGPPPPPGR